MRRTVDFHAGEVDKSLRPLLLRESEEVHGAAYGDLNGFHRMLHEEKARRGAGAVDDVVHRARDGRQRLHRSFHVLQTRIRRAQERFRFFYVSDKYQDMEREAHGLIGMPKRLYQRAPDEPGAAGHQHRLPPKGFPVDEIRCRDGRQVFFYDVCHTIPHNPRICKFSFASMIARKI